MCAQQVFPGTWSRADGGTLLLAAHSGPVNFVYNHMLGLLCDKNAKHARFVICVRISTCCTVMRYHVCSLVVTETSYDKDQSRKQPTSKRASLLQ